MPDALTLEPISRIAARLGICPESVGQACRTGKISECLKVGNAWRATEKSAREWYAEHQKRNGQVEPDQKRLGRIYRETEREFCRRIQPTDCQDSALRMFVFAASTEGHGPEVIAALLANLSGKPRRECLLPSEIRNIAWNMRDERRWKPSVHTDILRRCV